MEQRYVIIRVKGYDKASSQIGRGDIDISPDDVAIQTEDLSPRHVRDLARDPTIPAMSPSMPISLIEPQRQSGEETPPAEAWGLKAVGADATSCDGAGVTVAVLDTGIDASHPAFHGVKITEKDFSHSGNGDVDGHGSHCAGTILGRPVDGVPIGVAHGVHKALIGKVLSNNGGGSSEWLYQAIQWAISNHAHVISMSLGFDFPQMAASLVKRGYTVAQATSSALEAYRKNLRVFDALMQLSRAYRSLGTGGTVVVAATGNESTPQVHIAASMPAAAEGVIAVGALGQREGGLHLADFSNALPTVVAPGVDVLSAKAGGGLTTMSGTSMATPHVAGIAALWWQHGLRTRKETSARDVEAQILAHARPPAAHTTHTGKSGHAPDWGNGLVAAP